MHACSAGTRRASLDGLWVSGVIRVLMVVMRSMLFALFRNIQLIAMRVRVRVRLLIAMGMGVTSEDEKTKDVEE